MRRSSGNGSSTMAFLSLVLTRCFQNWGEKDVTECKSCGAIFDPHCPIHRDKAEAERAEHPGIEQCSASSGNTDWVSGSLTKRGIDDDPRADCRGVAIPAWVIQVFWIVLAVFIGVIAVRFLASML